MQSQQKQIPLISSKLKGSKIEYEVQKQGIIFLRGLRNKKFRIIFNIIGQDQNENQQNKKEQKIVNEFNELLLGVNNKGEQIVKSQSSGLETQSTILQQRQYLPYLSIHPSLKEISQNRVIVIMNSFIPPHSPPYLLIFGYLISSLVLYHNFSNEFSSQSPLTSLLCQFNKLLRETNIDQLNESIKFKTGYEKTPYFLCLLSKDSKDSKSHKEYQCWFNDFYRFREQEQNSKINYALQTIIDYFPQRASLGLQTQNLSKQQQKKLSSNGIKQVSELGHQFQQTILGRQLFTFEFTSTIIQSLAFQLCFYFNTQKTLDLIQLYNSVIQNKKARLQIQYSNRFLQVVRQSLFLGNRIEMQEVQMIQQGKSIFPVGDLVLLKMLQQIKQTIRQEMLQDAVNCMQLWEFVICEEKVTQKIKEYEQKLLRINAECGQRYIEECYGLVELGEDDIELVTQVNQQQSLTSQGSMIRTKQSQSNQQKNKRLQLATPQQIKQLFRILTCRLESFANECSSMFVQNDNNGQKYTQTFNKLANEYLMIIGMKLQETIEKVQIKMRQQQLQTDTLRYSLNLSIKQRKLLSQQYELQILIQTQLKQQLQSLILSINSNNQQTKLDSSKIITNQQQLNHNFIATQKQIHRLKQKIQLLQQQLKQKYNHIEDLSEILNQFQLTSKSLPDIKYQDKFNLTTKQLIEQANHKIKQFYNILQEVKQIQKHYQNAKKLLLKQKTKLIQQKKLSFKQVHAVKQISQKVKLQNKKLYEIVVEQKKTIENFTTIKQTLKQHILQLQSTNTQLTCALAQEQSDKELYRKALSLVVENSQKGKSQNLSKFYKFLQHKQIKQMIKPIVGKK